MLLWVFQVGSVGFFLLLSFLIYFAQGYWRAIDPREKGSWDQLLRWTLWVTLGWSWATVTLMWAFYQVSQ